MCLAVIVAVLAVYEDTASAGVSFRLSLGSGRFHGGRRSYGHRGYYSRYHRSSHRRSYYYGRYRPYHYYSRPRIIRYYPSSYYTSYSYYGPSVRQMSYYDYPTTTYHDYPAASYGGSGERVVVVKYIVVR